MSSGIAGSSLGGWPRKTGNKSTTRKKRSSETHAPTLAKAIEFGMEKHLPRSFPVMVRTTGHLLSLLETNPYSDFRISPDAKRVVTFLSGAHKEGLPLPIALDGAKILAMKIAEVLTAYVPHERGPVFIALIEKTFSRNVRTRTWKTVEKCAAV